MGRPATYIVAALAMAAPIFGILVRVCCVHRATETHIGWEERVNGETRETRTGRADEKVRGVPRIEQGNGDWPRRALLFLDGRARRADENRTSGRVGE